MKPLIPILLVLLLTACQNPGAEQQAALDARATKLDEKEQNLLERERTADSLISLYTEKLEELANRKPSQGFIRPGKHNLTLQWISWDHPGEVVITDLGNDRYSIKGEQRSKENDDYLKIEGTITAKSAKEFILDGTVEYSIYHIANGAPCIKEGPLTFLSTGSRKYWRMQEMDHCSDGTTDYVDVYF